MLPACVLRFLQWPSRTAGNQHRLLRGRFPAISNAGRVQIAMPKANAVVEKGGNDAGAAALRIEEQTP